LTIYSEFLKIENENYVAIHIHNLFIDV